MSSRIVLCVFGVLLVAGALAILGGDGWLPISMPLRQRLMDSDWSSEGVVEFQAAMASTGSSPEQLRRTVDVYHTLVMRDPSNPYRWCDLAESLDLTGDQGAASKAMHRAQVLGPAIPPILIRAANYYFSHQNVPEATQAYKAVLGLTHEYDGIIFLTLRRMGLQPADIIADVLPKNVDSARNFLASVSTAGDLAGADVVWHWMLANRLVSDPVAAQYVDFLLRREKGQAASDSWASYLGDRRGDYLKPDYLFNRGFALPPTGNRLDWHIEPLDNVETEVVPQGAGKALEIRFSGTANVAYRQVWQNLWVPAGGYRLRARVKAEKLTTNRSLQIHLTDPVKHQFDWISEPITGTHDWEWMDAKLAVPNCPFLLLEIIRSPSEKFDNKIEGTARFQDFSLVGTK